MKNLNLLGDKASGLTALPSVCSLQEQQLGLVEDIHQHGELSIHQWLQTLLQSVNNVLDTCTETQNVHSNVISSVSECDQTKLKASDLNSN